MFVNAQDKAANFTCTFQLYSSEGELEWEELSIISKNVIKYTKWSVYYSYIVYYMINDIYLIDLSCYVKYSVSFVIVIQN